MKKIISSLFVISLSLNAFAINTVSDNHQNYEKKADYTCTYEYYEEVILTSGDIIYVYIRSEIVECEAKDAGKVFEYVYDANSASSRIKPKRHGTGLAE